MSEPRETIFEQDEHKVPSSSYSVTVFVVLAGLALVQLAINFSDPAALGPWRLPLTLAVIGVQASVLAYFFMDLRQSDSLTWLCVGAALFWVFLLFLFTLTDYFTRYIAAL